VLGLAIRAGLHEGLGLIALGAVAPAGNLIRVRVAQPLPVIQEFLCRSDVILVLYLNLHLPLLPSWLVGIRWKAKDGMNGDRDDWFTGTGNGIALEMALESDERTA
jgi:hypothetical protein